MKPQWFVVCLILFSQAAVTAGAAPVRCSELFQKRSGPYRLISDHDISALAELHLEVLRMRNQSAGVAVRQDLKSKMDELAFEANVEKTEVHRRVADRVTLLLAERTTQRSKEEMVQDQKRQLVIPDVDLKIETEARIDLTKVKKISVTGDGRGELSDGAQWSPNGRYVAVFPSVSAGLNGTERTQVFEVKSGRVWISEGFRGNFSQEGDLWISTDSETVTLTDLATGDIVFRQKGVGRIFPQHTYPDFFLTEVSQSEGWNHIYIHRPGKSSRKLGIKVAYDRNKDHMLYFDMKRRLHLVTISTGEELPLPQHLIECRPSGKGESLLLGGMEVRISGQRYMLFADDFTLVPLKGPVVDILPGHIVLESLSGQIGLRIANAKNEVIEAPGHHLHYLRTDNKLLIANQKEQQISIVNLSTMTKWDRQGTESRWVSQGQWLGQRPPEMKFFNVPEAPQTFFHPFLERELRFEGAGQVIPLPNTLTYLQVIEAPEQRGLWLMDRQSGVAKLRLGEAKYGVAISKDGSQVMAVDKGMLRIFNIQPQP